MMRTLLMKMATYMYGTALLGIAQDRLLVQLDRLVQQVLLVQTAQ